MTVAYPQSIKSFLTYQDQPGDANHIVPDPDNPNQTPPATVDLTIDRALITNEIHDEVTAMERTMGATGAQVTVIPGTTTMGQEVKYLWMNKAPGRIDTANNAIYPSPPAPPPSHNHVHSASRALDADDHKQYMRVDGTRSFTAPVSAPGAVAGNQLATLGQAENAGYLNAGQVEGIVLSALQGATNHPILGPGPGRYRMTGGYFFGPSDNNGNVWIDFSAAQFAYVLSFVYMKNPFPGESMLGWYAYQYEEDQLPLLSLSPQGAWVQFIEDIVVDRRALVSMTWMALGV